jgi:hypothetical protein
MQLTPEHMAELAAARQRMRKLRRAVITANVDGWSVGVFGAATALFGLADLPSLALGLAMISVAVVELRTAGKLRRLEASAPQALGFNQIVLGGALFLYATMRLWAVTHGEDEYASLITQEPQLASMLGPMQDLTRVILIAVYVTVMGVAIFAQGGMAVYYFTRAGVVHAITTSTPAWILDMQRAGVLM